MKIKRLMRWLLPIGLGWFMLCGLADCYSHFRSNTTPDPITGVNPISYKAPEISREMYAIVCYNDTDGTFWGDCLHWGGHIILYKADGTIVFVGFSYCPGSDVDFGIRIQHLLYYWDTYPENRPTWEELHQILETEFWYKGDDYDVIPLKEHCEVKRFGVFWATTLLEMDLPVTKEWIEMLDRGYAHVRYDGKSYHGNAYLNSQYSDKYDMWHEMRQATDGFQDRVVVKPYPEPAYAGPSPGPPDDKWARPEYVLPRDPLPDKAVYNEDRRKLNEERKKAWARDLIQEKIRVHRSYAPRVYPLPPFEGGYRK